MMVKLTKHVKLVIVIHSLLLVIGCTSTELKISPEITSLQQGVANSYSSVGVKDVSTHKAVMIAGDMAEAFSVQMRDSGFAKEVHYPSQAHIKDIVFEVNFDAVMDAHIIPSSAKIFFTGLTWFMLEPVFWYNTDYTLIGNVKLLIEDKVIKNISATSHATVSVKLLALDEAAILKTQALENAKKALFIQLLNELQI